MTSLLNREETYENFRFISILYITDILKNQTIAEKMHSKHKNKKKNKKGKLRATESPHKNWLTAEAEQM